MECFSSETKLLAAVPFRSGLSVRRTILHLQYRTTMILRQAWPGFFENSGVYPDFPLRISRASKGPLQGGSSSSRGQHERA